MNVPLTLLGLVIALLVVLVIKHDPDPNYKPIITDPFDIRFWIKWENKEDGDDKPEAETK